MQALTAPDQEFIPANLLNKSTNTNTGEANGYNFNNELSCAISFTNVSEI